MEDEGIYGLIAGGCSTIFATCAVVIIVSCFCIVPFIFPIIQDTNGIFSLPVIVWEGIIGIEYPKIPNIDFTAIQLPKFGFPTPNYPVIVTVFTISGIAFGTLLGLAVGKIRGREIDLTLAWWGGISGLIGLILSVISIFLDLQ